MLFNCWSHEPGILTCLTSITYAVDGNVSGNMTRFAGFEFQLLFYHITDGIEQGCAIEWCIKKSNFYF